MSLHPLQLVVTYAGDITRKLDGCPSRINRSGDTEQVIEGASSTRVDPWLIIAAMEPQLLSDCRKLGTVLSHRWVFVQPIKP